MGYPVKQASTTQPLPFLLVLASDHISGATGKTPTVTLSKAGGGFAAPAGAVLEIGNGWYKVAGNAVDNDTLGPLIMHVTEASSDPVDDLFTVVAYNPLDAVRLGLTALPNAAANAAGGLPVSVAGALDMDDMAADVDAIETAVASLPSAVAIVAALKADAEWKTILADVNGVYTFDPVSHVLTLKDKAGAVTLATLTLTVNSDSVVTTRASA